MPIEPSSGQKWGLFWFAFLVMSLSIGSTLYFSGAFDGLWGQSDSKTQERYKHITMTDAEFACEQRAAEAFGERLKILSVDRFSSRLDRKGQMFRVFLKAEIYPGSDQQGIPRETFINCYTALHKPEILLFQYARDGHQFIAPGEEERGLFGL